MSPSNKINWSRKSIEELRELFTTEIHPDLRDNGLQPGEKPTYQDLVDAGYSGIRYTLRNHHSLTLGEFLEELGYDRSAHQLSDNYWWGIDAQTTIEELELYLGSYHGRKGTAETTIKSKRSRLARFARSYADEYGTANIVDRVRDDPVPARDERQRVRIVFDRLDTDLSSDESKYKHLSDVQGFYAWLERDRDAVFNPAANAPQKERWAASAPSKSNRDPPALNSIHVRSMFNACSSLEEELLIVAIGGWGLRRREVAELHNDQFILSDNDPRIVFENRKNGPGTVSIHYGEEILADRLGELADQSKWAGHIFPSPKDPATHIAPETVSNRFSKIAERAEATVSGKIPTPQYGRRFWYRTYADAVKELMKQIEFIAKEQGSSDATVVLENYLGEEEARKRRRSVMNDELSTAFDASQ